MSDKNRPKHIENLSLSELTQEQFIALANEALLMMDMHINYININGLIAITYNSYIASATEIKIKVENGIATIQSTSTGNELLDMGKNKKYVSEFISNFYEQKSALDAENLEDRYQVLKNYTFSHVEEIEMLPPTASETNIKKYFTFFIPQKGYFSTPIIINLNIFIFIAMVISGVNFISPDVDSILNWGANFRSATLEGEWWRLITNFFLHIGLLHLIVNMFALVYIGILLEPILGKTRFAFAYLLAGIMGSVTSLWWHSFDISAGASGAIFGMYGVFIAFLTTSIIDRTARKGILPSIIIFVAYSLIGGLSEGIDNAAHIGGLVSGLIIGYSFIPSLENSDQKWIKPTTIALLSVAVFSTSMFAYKQLPNTLKIYEANAHKFFAQEQMALDVYRNNANIPREDLLHEIESRGPYYWNENILVVEKLNTLDLPEHLKIKNKLLMEYCKLSIANYELIYKAIDEDKMDDYKSQIEAYHIKIDAKIKEIRALKN